MKVYEEAFPATQDFFFTATLHKTPKIAVDKLWRSIGL
jgi:hypothetical protein